MWWNAVAVTLACGCVHVASSALIARAPTNGSYPWGSTGGISKQAFVERIVNQLTVEELAQHLSLIKYTDFSDSNGNATNFASLVGNRGLGELNYWLPKDSEEYNRLQKLNIDSARVPVPVLQSGECLHTSARQNTTVFPTNLDLASTWNMDLIEQTAKAIALETRAVGQVNCYAPVLDLAKDARWGRNGENFGEDKFLTAQAAVAYINGLQNNGNLTSLSAVSSTIKHFLAHGVPEGGRNAAPAMVGKRQLYTEYALPFRDAVQLSHAKGVMMSYNSIDSVAAVTDPELYGALGDWGFDGRVISDDHDIYRSLYWQGTATDPVDAISKWLNAGGSVNYADWSNSQWISYVSQAVTSGQVQLSTLRQRVTDLMNVKYDLGLFDNPYLPANFSQGKVDTPNAQQVALQGAQQSIVLLKNDNGTLPLSKTPGKVALVGPFIDMATLGGYTKQGIFARRKTLRQGFLEHLGADSIESSWGASEWLDLRSQIIPYDLFTPAKRPHAPYANTTTYTNSTTYANSTDPFFPSDNPHGLFATYYRDTNFSQVAWETIEGPLLEYNIYPPNSPDGTQILQSNSFSVVWEGSFSSPYTVNGALGAMVSGGWAQVYVDGQPLINATNSVVNSYCDGPQDYWSHYQANATQIPVGLAPFQFTKGHTYNIRIEFVSHSSGLVAPAWNLVDRTSFGGAVSSAVQNAVRVAQDSDLIVLAVGSSPPSDQETCDVSTLELTPAQTSLAEAIFNIGKPVILVTYGPRPKAIPEFYSKASAVLRSGYAGQAGGQGVADVLFGAVNPSGRLPMSIPYSAGAIPAYYNHQNSDYHYRYIDLPFQTINGTDLPEGSYGSMDAYNPLYHFGYGLSYTTFNYGTLSVQSNSGGKEFTANDTLRFAFSVQNTGQVKGRAVPQIYLLWRSASVAQPQKQLYGFANIELGPGEQQDVQIDLDVQRYLSGYNINMDWVVEGNNFTFALMNYSGDNPTNSVTLALQQ